MKSFRDYRGEDKFHEYDMGVNSATPPPPLSKAHDGGKNPLKSWQKKVLLDMAREYSFESVMAALQSLDGSNNMAPAPAPAPVPQAVEPAQDRPTNDDVSDNNGETSGGYGGYGGY
jgi:hypothetical protein